MSVVVMTVLTVAWTQPKPPPPSSDAVIVAVKERSLWLGKPPLGVHRFDITLANPSKEARWLVIPSTFPYKLGGDSPAPGGPLAELQIFRLSRSPNVLLVEAVGATFQAVKLPGRGRITLRNLAIESWWSEPTTKVELEILVARDVRVGERSLDALLEKPVLSASKADVACPKDAGDKRAQAFWHPSKPESAPTVRFVVESRARKNLELDPKVGTGRR